MKKRLVWISGVTCNGQTHSFLTLNKVAFDSFCSHIEIVYHPMLTRERSLKSIIDECCPIDFLVIEGGIHTSPDGWSSEGTPFLCLLDTLLLRSTIIITLGTCATFGGIHAQANPEVTSLEGYCTTHLSESEGILSKVVALPGCPVHPQWLTSTVLTLAKTPIAIDEKRRPKFLFSKTTHEGCTRNEYFEWKIDGTKWGSKGCLFYDQGCKGPMSLAPCNEILWNDVSSKTRAGVPCIGCTQEDFPRLNLFQTKKHMGLPADIPLGVSKKAYFSLAGVAKTFTHGRIG